MSYTDIDRSVHDAAPIEVFFFEGRGKTYAYTNADREVIVGGITYIPTQISMSETGVSAITENVSETGIVMPFDIPLAVDFGYMDTPSRLTVTARRVLEGTNWLTDSEVMFMGEAVSFNVTEFSFIIVFNNPLTTRLAGMAKMVYLDTPCNHILFDARCGVSRSTYTTTTTVVTASDDAVTVTDDGVADGALRGGTITLPRTGEQQMIIDNLANVLTLGHRFIDILPGDNVQLTRGCDRSRATCIDVFDNGEHHGGFLYIPLEF